MKNNKILLVFLCLIFMLFSLTSCENVTNDNTTTKVEHKITDDNKISYKVMITNSTIYNYENVDYEVYLYNNNEQVIKIYDNEKPLTIEHGKTMLYEGTYDNNVKFDEIRVVNYEYTALSFFQTYKHFIILMPIITVVISGIVFYVLFKNEIEKSEEQGRVSVIGVIGLLAMLSMINYVGWVPILFMFVAAGMIFGSGFLATVLKKRKYVPVEIKNQTEEKIIEDTTVVESNEMLIEKDETND